MRNALTFDVEEYFQVEAFRGLVRDSDWDHFESRVVPSTERLLNMLDASGVSATFFVVGWVARRHSSLVQAIQRRGHEVACHSDVHRPIYSMDPETFRKDLVHAKQVIEDASGVPLVGYRAPTFSIVKSTLWALDILAEEGFAYDASVFPIHHDRYGMPGANPFPHRLRLPKGGAIVEFPMTTFRTARRNLPFSGGGYFRLLPYPLIRAALRHVNEHDRVPAMVYLHPWELDPDQPRFPVHGLTRFRHYVNLRSTAHKLARLLDDFTFGPVREVLRARGFAEVPAA